MSSNDRERTGEAGVGLAKLRFEKLQSGTLGFAFRAQRESDHGIDAQVELFRDGVATGQLVGLQIKSGDSYFREAAPRGWWLRTDEWHADYWLNHALPVLLLQCDLDAERVYWQVVDPETIISTGKRRKILVPMAQQVTTASVDRLSDLLTPIVPSGQYTIFREEDTSHGMAKRYSLDIVLKGKLSKADAASVVRAATAEARQGSHHRNEIASARWSGKEADVVWTFVYPSAEDRAHINWYCRSVWISEDLDHRDRPSRLDGENVGDDITIDWKADYESLAGFLAEHSTNKHDYLSAVLPMVDNFEALLARQGEWLDRLQRAKVDLASFLRTTSDDRRAINGLYMGTTYLPLAPFECSEVDKKFSELAASMDNMVRPHSKRGLQTWTAADGLWNAQQARKNAVHVLGHLRYELSKIR